MREIILPNRFLCASVNGKEARMHFEYVSRLLVLIHRFNSEMVMVSDRRVSKSRFRLRVVVESNSAILSKNGSNLTENGSNLTEGHAKYMGHVSTHLDRGTRQGHTRSAGTGHCKDTHGA